MTHRLIKTSAGEFTAWFSRAGLSGLAFPGSILPSPAEESSAPDNFPKSAKWTETTATALESVLNGSQPRVLPPLDLTVGTDFQQRVWRALLEIPAGETRSYLDIARLIGSPGATRAVGSACGANPIPVLIPCHRVIASGGKIGGFSSDMRWKIRLLELEGAWPLTKRETEPEFAFE